MVDYLISQRDERVERAEQVAAVRATYAHNLEMGFPVAAGTTDEDRPALRWQVRSLEAQERLRMNLRLLKRRGRWDFVNDLQPPAPLKLASMIRADDMAGIVDYFMPFRAESSGMSGKRASRTSGTFSHWPSRRRSWNGSGATSTSPRISSRVPTRPGSGEWRPCRRSSPSRPRT